MLKLLLQGGIILGNKKYKIGLLNWFFLKTAAQNEMYDMAFYNFMKDNIDKEIKNFIDVGTNVGQTFLKVLQLFPEVNYYGIEPQITSAYKLHKFITKNKLSKTAKIFTFALSNQTHFLELGINRGDDVTASVNLASRPKGFYDHTIVIPAMKGDDFFDNWKIAGSTVIKIDVEGAEYQVLKGLKNTISEIKPIIFFEVLPTKLVSTNKPLSDQLIKEREADCKRIEDFFEKNNYKLIQTEGEDYGTVLTELRPDKEMVMNIAAFPK